MELYPSLSFDCFDRLFPNQYIMPEGGFGNLIALPLQFSPRQQNNSVFIDKDGRPYSDQWAKLASIEKLSQAQLNKHFTELIDLSVASDALYLGDGSDDSNEKPWQRSETFRNGQTVLIKVANCPKEIILVLADQVYIPISNLPASNYEASMLLSYMVLFQLNKDNNGYKNYNNMILMPTHQKMIAIIGS